MELTKELTELVETDLELLDGFEMEYKNGGTVKGTAKKIRFHPLRMTILKDDTRKGERPKHKVVFDHLVKFSLLYKNGNRKDFS